MKRYNFKPDPMIPCHCCMPESESGSYVRYEDVAKILRGAKILLRVALANAKSQKSLSDRINYFMQNSLKDI